MSYGIAVKLLDHAGGAHLAGGQSWFKVQGQPVVIFGDHVIPHGPPIPIHLNASMTVDKSSWMTLDGIGVIRESHHASCGHQSSGRPWFEIPD